MPEPANDGPVGPDSPERDPHKTPDEQKPASPPKKRRKRRWLKVMLAMLLVLILLVVFAPNLASTGVGRKAILGIANGSLNGKAEVDDWSIGWTSGIRMQGVRVRDEQGQIILQASKVSTQLPLLKTLLNGFSKIDLGRTEIEGLDLTRCHIDEQGVVNYAKLAKPGKPKEPKKDAAAMEIAGDVHVTGMTGTITAANVAEAVRILPSDISAKTENGLWTTDVRVSTDFGTITVSGKAPQQALERLAREQAPGSEGQLTVVVDLPKAPELANHLRQTLKFLPGVKLESGKLYAQADVWLSAKDVTGKLYVLSAAKGTRTTTDAQTKEARTMPIELKPIEQSLDFTWRPTAGAGTGPGDGLRNVSLVFTSGFAALKGGTGPDGSLAKFELRGEGDLGKLREQLAQFVDVQGLELQGQFTVSARTDGDPAKPDMPMAFNVGAELKDLRVAGLSEKMQAIAQPWLKLTSSGKLHMKGGAPDAIREAVLALRSDSEANPTVDVLARGGLDLKTLASPGFEVERCKIDLARAGKEFGAMAPVLEWFTKGQINLSLAGVYDGKSIVIAVDKPLAVVASGVTVVKPGDKGGAILADRSVEVKLAGAIDFSKETIGARLSDLSIVSEPLVSIRKKEGEFVVSMSTAQGTLQGRGGVDLTVMGKEILDIVQSMGGKPAPQQQAGQLKKGTLKGDLVFARTQVGNQPITPITGNFDADVEVQTARQGEAVKDKLKISLNARAPDDLTQPVSLTVDIKGEILTTALSNAELVLMRQKPDKTVVFNAPLEIPRKLHLSVNVPRVEVVQAIANSFGTGEAKAEKAGESTAAAEPAAPADSVQLASGALAITVDAVHDGQTLKPSGEVLLTGYRIERGKAKLEPGDQKVNLRFAAAIQSGASGAVSRVDVTELSGDLDVGQVKMTTPIVLAELDTRSPKMTGGVEVAGKLADVFRLLEVVQGAASNTYLYTGDYTLAQTLAMAGTTIKPNGLLSVRNLEVFTPKDTKRPVLKEDLLTLANDVEIEPGSGTLKVNNITLDSKSTRAIRLAITSGTFVDWANQRKISEKFQATARIDWARLWELVRPMMDPKMVQSLELKVAGVMDRKFEVWGAFPATGADRRGKIVPLPLGNSMRFLSASGGLAFDQLSVMGFDFSKLDVPVAMEKGVATVAEVAPATCNGGTFDLAGLILDLRHMDPDDPTKLDPHVSIAQKNKRIFSNVTLNPLLADSTIGRYNPAFLNAREATGLFNFTSIECMDVPLSWFQRDADMPVAKRGRARKPVIGEGRARFTFSVQKVRLNNFVLVAITGKPIDGDIRQGEIAIEKGLIATKVPIAINDQLTLSFDGAVNLQTGVIKEFSAAVPVEVLDRNLFAKVPAPARKLLPQSIVIPFTGAADKPQFDVGAAITKSLKSGGKPEDLLKNLPDLLGGEKDKKEERDKPRPRR